MATENKSNAPPTATEGDEVKQLKEELKQSKEQVADLTGKVSDLQGTIISPQYQEYMKAQNQPQTFQPTDFAAGRTGEIDLEAMDRKEYSTWLLGEMDKRFGPRIDLNAQNLRQYQLQGGIKDAKGKWKNFDNYKKAMGKTAARLEAGDIRAEDVYKIESWTPPAESEEKGKGTVASEKPTGATSAPTDTKKLTLAEKASKIWEEKGIDEKFPSPTQ